MPDGTSLSAASDNIPGLPESLTVLSNDELESRITALAGNLNAATYRLIVLIAEFDRREVWGGWGVKSAAHWLNWKCGIDMGAAREKVRVARALAGVPKIAAAFACGELSFSKVRAMTRIATPENEDYLMMIARHGTANHVELLVSTYRGVLRQHELERAGRLHQERHFSFYHDDDGMLIIKARLEPEHGAALMKAIESARKLKYPYGKDDAEHDAIEEARQERASYPAQRADALAMLAESYLAGGTAERSGGDRSEIVIHIDAPVLHEPRKDGRCELEDGPAIAVETVRRLACDAALVEITEDHAGTPLDIGRRTRTIPPAIRRALQSRDRGCVFPGCTSRHYTDAHHIEHWADGGATKLDNLILLCRHHHRLVHEGGFAVEKRFRGNVFAGVVFRRPDGRVIQAFPAHPPPTRLVEAENADAGLVLNDETAVTLWAGEHMDLGLAVEGLVVRGIGL